jgi:hypothetical protein
MAQRKQGACAPVGSRTVGWRRGAWRRQRRCPRAQRRGCAATSAGCPSPAAGAGGRPFGATAAAEAAAARKKRKSVRRRAWSAFRVTALHARRQTVRPAMYSRGCAAHASARPERGCARRQERAAAFCAAHHGCACGVQRGGGGGRERRARHGRAADRAPRLGIVQQREHLSRAQGRLRNSNPARRAAAPRRNAPASATPAATASSKKARPV